MPHRTGALNVHASDTGVPIGVFPRSMSRIELEAEVLESADAFRCQGLFPNNFLGHNFGSCLLCSRAAVDDFPSGA
jgi:hypothetical protein